MADYNMNVRFGADTSGINKGARDAKAAVRDFAKVSDNAMSGLGQAFGVPTQKLEQLGSAIKGMGLQMTTSANSGVASFGKLLASINKVSLAVAGMGIGAAVIAFNQLNKVAENFKGTVAGINLELSTKAYTDTFSQIFYDANSAAGQAWANFQMKGKKAVTAVGAVMTSMWTNSDSMLGLNPKWWKETISTMKFANAQGEQAARWASEINDLTLQRSKNAAEWADMESQAAYWKNVSLDKTKSQEERSNALAKAEELIRQRYTEQYDIESRIADLMESTNNLAESTPQAIDAANAQRRSANSLLKDMEQSLSRIISKQQNLTTSVKETTDAVAESVTRSPYWNSAVSGTPAGAATTGMGGGLVGGGNVEQITLAMRGLKDYSQEVTAYTVEGIATMSNALGELVGDLVTGGDAWENFGNTALSAFADMMQSIGKLVLKEGIAVTAVWKSLTDPASAPLAIAAGAALVAIGASIKAGLSNVAQGNYSASSSVASGSYSSSSSSSTAFHEREFNVKVTGTLQASGSQLVAVLNNENRRTRSTT